MCQKIGSQPTSSPSSGGGSAPAAGPIAGGVIGGIVVVCLMTFLVWRFCVKKRRQPYSESDWPEVETIGEKGGDDFGTQRDRRTSTHSVRSIASTVLTRASNVIQIAYIPGVTNRSVESTPDLIPPVPPIPAMSAPGSTATTPQPSQQDQHFFMPSDLRDSTYSDYTVDRQSYARSSMAPSMARGSVPSTAYRGSAVVNAIPAQTAIRGKANPVAVRSGGKNSPTGTPRAITPPVPIIDRQRHAPSRQNEIQTNTTSPIVARLGVPKAVQVKRAPSKDNVLAAASVPADPSPVNSEKSQRSIVVPALERHLSTASSRHDGASSTFDDASSDEDSPADQSLMGHEKLPQFAKTASLSSKSRDSPFKAPSSAPDLRHSNAMALSSSSSSPDSQAYSVSKAQKQRHKRSGSLNQIIEEAARRASREPRHGGLGSLGNIDMAATWRDKEGPFSDAHIAGTP
ncbi:protein OPY2, partial [Lecanoromycetidae sp. Uapishka_2]